MKRLITVHLRQNQESGDRVARSGLEETDGIRPGGQSRYNERSNQGEETGPLSRSS
jgi:hypothetical protein